MTKRINQSIFVYLPILVGLAWIVWWLKINFGGMEGSRDNFTDTYSMVALTGFIVGIVVAQKWGGFKSRFGRAISFFAIGLGLQFLGQLIYAYYFRVLDVELAYPSVGDIPYLLSNVMYILGVINLLRVIIIKGNVLRPLWVLLVSLLATGAVLFGMYHAFLNIAITDERGDIYQLVNAAYPVIQSIYFLLGIVALLQARLIASGKMFKSVLVLLIALSMQYVADFTFLYQSYHETWEAAGYNDLLFVISYTGMALAIAMIDRSRRQIVQMPAKAEAQNGQ